MKKTESKIGDLLAGAMGRAGIVRQVGAAVIVQAGDTALTTVFDDGILQFAKCRSYQDGCLLVACLHSALAQDIQLQTANIINLVTEKVPGADIRSIRVIHANTTGGDSDLSYN